MTGHFRKKSLFFRDTREHPEQDAKNRLSLSSPSPEKPLAKIDELKITDLRGATAKMSTIELTKLEERTLDMVSKH